MIKVRGMSSDRNLVGDHPWLGGTTYGAVDSPAGPSMAAIDSPVRPSMATKFIIDGPVGPVVGGTIGGVTAPSGLFTTARRLNVCWICWL